MSKLISPVKREKVFTKYDSRCAYCGCLIEYSTFHIDHIIPKYKKGKNDLSNLNPACPTCNLSKGCYLIDDWRDSIQNRAYDSLNRSTDLKILFKFNQIELTNIPVIFYFETYGGR